MKRKEYLIITSLTLVALLIGYILTYDSYCGFEGCASQGGFPLSLFVYGGAGFETSPSFLGIVVDSIFYFTIFYTIFRLKNVLSKQN